MPSKKIGAVGLCGCLTHVGGGWFPKLVWPKHYMINQQVKIGVANNDKRAKCWCGTGKVGVATATPVIRHSPPMRHTESVRLCRIWGTGSKGVLQDLVVLQNSL